MEPVFAGARLAFVGVADDVSGFARGSRDKAPLQARWESGAAPATQVRRFQLVDDRFGSHPDGFLDRNVSIVRKIRIDRS